MFDFSPLYRSTVGFDRLVQMLDNAANYEAPTYPPYNIERVSENAFRITMAVAGFGPDDVNIEVKQNALTIAGKKADANGETEYLHQGIAARAFERRFQLADHVEVTGAELSNGLLHVSLKREIPEAMKPRTVAITKGTAPEAIENKKAA